MKKLLSILFLSLILASCSSNTEDVQTQLTNITGTWKLYSSVRQQNEISTSCDLQYGKLIINSTESLIKYDGSLLVNNCSEVHHGFLYSISDNILIITQNDQAGYVNESRYSIIETTPTTLRVKLIYIKKTNVSGTVDENYLQDSQRITFSYTKQ